MKYQASTGPMKFNKTAELHLYLYPHTLFELPPSACISYNHRTTPTCSVICISISSSPSILLCLQWVLVSLQSINWAVWWQWVFLDTLVEKTKVGIAKDDSLQPTFIVCVEGDNCFEDSQGMAVVSPLEGWKCECCPHFTLCRVCQGCFVENIYP